MFCVFAPLHTKPIGAPCASGDALPLKHPHILIVLSFFLYLVPNVRVSEPQIGRFACDCAVKSNKSPQQITSCYPAVEGRKYTLEKIYNDNPVG